MIRGGSSDAEIFAVHASTYQPSFAGYETLERGRYTRNYGPRGKPAVPYLIADPVGEIRTWQYRADTMPEAQIWVVRDAGGTVIRVWEAEDAVCDMPIWPYNKIEESIIPAGGSLVRLVKPGCEVLDVIAGQVGSMGAVQTRFLAMQRQREYRLVYSLESLHAIEDVGEKWKYTLLWLRAASQDIYGHTGETCIPLLKSRLVDGLGVLV